MAITIKKEIETFTELYQNSWSGAIDVLDEIMNQDREDEAFSIIEDYMNDCCNDEIPTDTEVNDFIWFELADIMNLYEDDDSDEDEEAEEEE